MAFSSIYLFSFFFVFFFFFFSTTTVSAMSADSNIDLAENAINLTFYLHATLAGPNQTVFTVASLNGSSPFGDIFVYDNPLTGGPDPGSPEIGRVQGTDAVAAFDGSLLTMANYVFTAWPFNGSYITVTGRADATTGTADRTIVGGGGQFRLARGYAESAVYYANATYQVLVNYFYVLGSHKGELNDFALADQLLMEYLEISLI